MPLRASREEVPAPAPGAHVERPLFTLSGEQWRITRRVARTLLVLGAVYGIGWLLWSTRSALTPFVIGLVLAYVLMPLVNRLGERLPRWAAILVVYVVGSILVGATIAFIVPPAIDQIRQLITNMPSIDEIQAQSEIWLAWYRSTVPLELQGPIDQAASRALTTLQSNLTIYLQNLGTFLVNSVLQVANTLTFLLGFLVIPFWLFYVLMDHQAALRTVDRLLPQAVRDDVWAIARIFDNIFRKYLGGQLFLGLVVGVVAGAGLFILSLFGLRVPYILLLAIFAGITELIPVIGPVIGAVPAIALGFFDSPTTALAVAALYIGIQQLENQFLVPRIVGESVGIHPAVLMVLLIVCSQAFGLLGAILAAPVSAVVRDVFSYLYLRLSEPGERKP
jgi:predicted PurR-regulated permease PerM